VNGAQALHPAGIRSRCSRYGELPRVNLVRVCSDSNKHFILAPGCTNTRSVLPSFETGTEASSDRLMGSAKPGHIEPSDWSAARKTDDGYQGKERSC